MLNATDYVTPALGMSLLPGQVVLAGSFTGALKVKSGDTIHADFREMGSISCYFE